MNEASRIFRVVANAPTNNRNCLINKPLFTPVNSCIHVQKPSTRVGETPIRIFRRLQLEGRRGLALFACFYAQRPRGNPDILSSDKRTRDSRAEQWKGNGVPASPPSWSVYAYPPVAVARRKYSQLTWWDSVVARGRAAPSLLRVYTERIRLLASRCVLLRIAVM